MGKATSGTTSGDVLLECRPQQNRRGSYLNATSHRRLDPALETGGLDEQGHSGRRRRLSDSQRICTERASRTRAIFR